MNQPFLSFVQRSFFPVVLGCILSPVLAQNTPRWKQSSYGAINIVSNPGGATLGYSPASGVKILTIGGLAFKDLNKNGKLDAYEDWRLPVEARAKDLAGKLSVEQIAGLMLYSAHQAIPAAPRGFGAATYGGKPFPESGALASDLTDQQKKFLAEDNLRHVLVTRVQSPEVAAQWNNNLQAFVEGLGLGIPANNSSDPRHSAVASTEYNAGAGGAISMWPESLGMAATFDPSLVRQFGRIAAREYRALGIATALSPQVDLATEPRWSRFNGTFGEDPQLATEMAKAYIDGFQTSTAKDEISNGWGYTSVNAMVKHWPGGGPEEGGRDAHFAYGKFAVYPGNNFQTQLTPFVDGAFKLEGKTKRAAAVMPYYTISFNQDKVNDENVGNGYSKYIVTDLLRNKYGYDGVVCTDWLVTADEGKTPDVFAGKSWGVEKLSVAERHYKVLMAGVDQFGGNNAAGPVLEAYSMGVKEHGEQWMRRRFEQSAVRLLRNIFQVGLFENPYLDPEESKKTVGQPEFMKAGYEAQLRSIVLLKNKGGILPLKKGTTVYIPKRVTPAGRDWFGNVTPEKIDYPVSIELVKKYFSVTDDPTKADVAIVFVKGPAGGVGYSKEDKEKGGSGYVPISLQYGPYTAETARQQSLAAGDPVVDPTNTNRSYKGKTITAANYTDLKTILDTKTAMAGKPVIVSLALSNPAVMAEFEKEVQGILASFGVQDQALLDLVSGAVVPSGLLPLQMPANMQTVEAQQEDVPLDMQPHIDSEGHSYDFAYGLNWKGVINDSLTAKYKRPAKAKKSAI
ncbi:glycoside hydrolase family 3 protein [Flavisolibacter nicotianae]|uniref:glycoside hydrolase family 3 protein n=1 Tax=Flavisolibacter nicotianae TaxID=2364882 RepID=UPI000EAC1FD5|nr:glycoside hydrolase family 3 N-terminal domain-containing protein [Flavisolibacter nicotianae]